MISEPVASLTVIYEINFGSGPQINKLVAK